MCGMRAGMRCAQLREGAGGSGGPATGPSGRRLGCGRGQCGREPSGGGGPVGAELAVRPRGTQTWTAVFGSGLSRSPAHKLPLSLFLLPKLQVPAPPDGLSDSFPGAGNLPLSRVRCPEGARGPGPAPCHPPRLKLRTDVPPRVSAKGPVSGGRPERRKGYSLPAAPTEGRSLRGKPGSSDSGF